MAWLLVHAPPDVFLGNPRVHFQHYADRMNEPRRAQRAWRAWACWAITRAVRPEFPGDPRHPVIEPALAAIAAGLRLHGCTGEAETLEARPGFPAKGAGGRRRDLSRPSVAPWATTKERSMARWR